jgi:3alpha(or 20beta)-hydroxysteroid dehydrogenase
VAGRLEGKVALITGAARGQGAAEARLFVQEGAKVLLTDVLDEAGEALARELGPAARYQHLDVSREDEWARAVSAAERLGRLNVLVNNAAVLFAASIADTTLADYQRVIGVNQVGCFLGIRAVMEPMKRAGGGSIVNVSSIDGLQSKNGLMAYSSSKWAIRGITKCAAIELGRHGIRVNSIHPGGIDTPMGNPTGMGFDEMNDWYVNHPIPRVGRPVEVAWMAVFLASDEASYCTGSEYPVDGGWNAGLRVDRLPGG